MWAAGTLCRQVPADAAAPQLGVTGVAALPLLPDDRPQASPDPLVELAQYRRGLAEAEVAAPSDEIAGQLLDDLLGGRPARAPRQFPSNIQDARGRAERHPRDGGRVP